MRLSHQKQAKEAQGYTLNPVQRICSNCKHYKSQITPSQWNPKYFDEKQIRCGIGGFAVKRTASCKKFELNEDI